MDEPRPPENGSDHDAVHAGIARWERRWLAASAFMSLTFVLLIAWNLATEGAHIAQGTSRAAPEVLLSNAMFEQPGLRTLAPGSYQLTVVAQAFNFTPAEVVLPVGAEVEFFATARDVIHGYQLERTNINVELIPGEVARFLYTFDEPGEYQVICNEYCGISHHTMLGVVRVVPQSVFAQQGDDADGGADMAAGALGESVYAANCASCHQANGQGLAGVFPPLVEHAPALLEQQGRDYLINLLLYGLQGPIEVLGENYNGVMPAWQQLPDDEIAAVLNHTLTAWGNDALLPGDFEPFTADEIEPFRGTALTADEVWQQRADETGGTD